MPCDHPGAPMCPELVRRDDPMAMEHKQLILYLLRRLHLHKKDLRKYYGEFTYCRDAIAHHMGYIPQNDPSAKAVGYETEWEMPNVSEWDLTQTNWTAW